MLALLTIPALTLAVYWGWRALSDAADPELLAEANRALMEREGDR